MSSWNRAIFWEWLSPVSCFQALTLLFLGQEGPFLPFNPDGVFAFMSNIGCNYTVESDYKGKRTVTHRLYHVSLQTRWIGQLKSKIGWLEISVYFIININCPGVSSDINTGPNSDDTVWFATPASLVIYDGSGAACIWWHIYNCCGSIFNQSIKLGPFGGKHARKRQLSRVEARAESRQWRRSVSQRSPQSPKIHCFTGPSAHFYFQ